MKRYDVLLIGSGAREHALAWKISQSKFLNRLLVWPANPAMLLKYSKLPTEKESLLDVAMDAKKAGIEVVVFGPEFHLANGGANIFESLGMRVFGPRMEVARLESSKVFAKELMLDAGIPTAPYTIASDPEETHRLAALSLAEHGRAVLKADNLAAGKGVFVCANLNDVNQAVRKLFSGIVDPSCPQILVEEPLSGRECSYFAMLGKGAPVSCGFAVDFKRAFDGDLGPNTGGMGAYSPVPWLPGDAEETVNREVIDPLLTKLNAEGMHYTGFIYVGLFWNSQGPKVVEFNVRLGDPEAQVLAVRDQRDWLHIILMQLGLCSIDAVPKTSDDDKAVGVVVCSPSYPASEKEGDLSEIPGDWFGETDAGAMFGAALQTVGDRVRVGSGRVLTVVRLGDTFAKARADSLVAAQQIGTLWPKARWRRDIAENAER